MCLSRFQLSQITLVVLAFTLIIEINHIHCITHVKYLGRLSGATFGKNRYSGRLTFGRRNKTIEGSINMKFTHNVDYDR